VLKTPKIPRGNPYSWAIVWGASWNFISLVTKLLFAGMFTTTVGFIESKKSLKIMKIPPKNTNKIDRKNCTLPTTGFELRTSAV
jgi:hypothetical protein